MASLQLCTLHNGTLKGYRFRRLERGCYEVLVCGDNPGDDDVAVGEVEKYHKIWKASGGLLGSTRRQTANELIWRWFWARERLLPRPAEEKMCPCQFCLRCCCKYTPGLEGNVGICSNLEDGECDCEREAK